MKRLVLILGLITSFVYAQSKAGFYVVGGQLITVHDTSSRKYLKAVENAGVVPSVLQNMASNFLVTTEKAIGSYSLMSAQYPFIGGTAATHKFNLNDPRDLDAAFRLTYGGTVTHSALGMQGDGSTGYADTKFIASNLSFTNSGLSIYMNTSTGYGVDMAVNPNATLNARFALHANSSSGDLNIRSAIGVVSADAIVSFASFKGYLSGNRSALNRQTLTYNGNILVSTITDNAGSMPSASVFISAINNGAIGVVFSPRRYGYSAIHQAFTDTQSTQQSQIVTSFNGFLSRQ